MNVLIEQLLDELEVAFPLPRYKVRYDTEDGTFQVDDTQTGGRGSFQFNMFDPASPSDVVRWLKRQLGQ